MLYKIIGRLTMLFLLLLLFNDGMAMGKGTGAKRPVYTITGSANVLPGSEVKYTSASALPSNYHWEVTCGTFDIKSSSQIIVDWPSSGCSFAVVYIKDNSGNIINMMGVTIAIPPPLNGGTINANAIQSILANTAPLLLNATPAFGGACSTYPYQWQSSTDGVNFSNISGATGVNYQPGNLSVTTWYRRMATCSPGTAYTDLAKISVYPPVTGGAISPSSLSININTIPGALTCGVATGGSGTYTYQWQSSTDGLTFSGVTTGTGANTLNYQPAALSVTTYYQVMVTNTPFVGYSSNRATVTVYPQLTPGSISPSSAVINYNTSPGQLTGSLPTGGNGIYAYQWKYSLDNGASWSDAPGASASQNYTPGNLSATISYKREVTSNTITVSTPSVLITVTSPYGVIPATNNTGNANTEINWIQSSSYDETGLLIGDSKQFFDNNGHSIQTQNKVFYRKDLTTVYTHVLATQPVRDVLGRDAAVTLPAPINYADFSYQPSFMLHNSAGVPYSYQHFDLYANGTTNTDKTNTPDPLWDASTGSPVKGTLAWYYSTSNIWEPYTPVTNYPYSRQTFYQDGTGNGKKSAGLGDPVKMGTGHEASSYITPVVNELDFYIRVRNQYFSATEMGALPGSLQNQAIQTVSRDANGIETISIRDRGGKTLVTARAGSGLMAVNNSVTVGGPTASDMTVYYFKLLAAGAVGVSAGSYTLYDMNTELPVPSFSNGSTVPAGYYKLVNTGSAALTLTYSNTYTDISYNFYDQKGQLVATIAPEGVKKLYGTDGSGSGLALYTTRTSIPFISLNTYDARGRLVSSQDGDGGAHHFVYRNDGKIRFSQNAAQAVSGSFSYTNYDPSGRAIESGQYDGSGITFGSVAMSGILENTSPGGGVVTGTKTDVSQTQYDEPDDGSGLSASGYTQNRFNLAGAVSVTRKYNAIVNNAPNSANLMSATWYNYDEEGKTVWTIRYINGLGTIAGNRDNFKTTDYSYDVLGHLVRRVFQAGQPDAFTHIYDYDPVNKQLWHVSTIAGTGSPVLQATYIYYLHGGLKRVELATNLQGIDYAYTLQGALKAVNNSNKTQDPGNDGVANGFAVDAFGEVLDYYSGDYTNGRDQIPVFKPVDVSSIPGNIIPESYAGNIKAMSWYSKKPNSVLTNDPNAEDPKAYVYNYDPKYQFTESTWGGVTFNSTPATFSPVSINKEKIGNPTPYDGNGNIQYLQRTYANGATPPDQFSYHYDNNNNQLTSITNTVAGVSQPYATYTYDLNGQMTAEAVVDGSPQKYMVYDVTGKVTAVYSDINHTQASQLAGFVYGETGQRIKKTGYNSSGQINKVTYYLGGVIYTQMVTNGSYGAVTVQEYEISGADRVGVYFPYPQMPVYAYEMKDHLGNVRAVIAQNNNTLDVRACSDYYPYGMALGHGGTDEYRYGYQGQNAEKDPETGWNAFELRMYDSKIARWLQYDPAGQFFSPYVGMGNDPVRGIDKNGGEDDEFSPIFDTKGILLGTDDQGLQGQPIIMNSADFVQNMSHQDAVSKDLGLGALIGTAAKESFLNTYYSLPGRPDWDGYVTKAEGDAWYSARSGRPLYIDVSKITLPGVTTQDFGKGTEVGAVFTHNFGLQIPLSNTGQVYGTLDLTLLNAATGEVRIGYRVLLAGNTSPVLDRYDFDHHEVHGLDLDERFRNFATWVGEPSGGGVGFNFEGYGRNPTVPVLTNKEATNLNIIIRNDGVK